MGDLDLDFIFHLKKNSTLNKKFKVLLSLKTDKTREDIGIVSLVVNRVLSTSYLSTID